MAWYVSSHTFKDLISRSQTWYWHRAPDPGSRSHSMYNGDNFEKWDVEAEQPADLVIVQMGGNDHRHPNEIPGPDFYYAYVELIEDIHKTWPHSIILIMVCSPFWSNGVLGLMEIVAMGPMEERRHAVCAAHHLRARDQTRA